MFSVLENGVCVAIGTHFVRREDGVVFIRRDLLQQICLLIEETDNETDTMCWVAVERRKSGECVTVQELCTPASASKLAMWIKTAAFFVGDVSGVLHYMYAPVLSESWDVLKDELIAGLQRVIQGDSDGLGRLALLCIPYPPYRRRPSKRYPCKLRNIVQSTYNTLIRRVGSNLCVPSQTVPCDGEKSLYGLTYDVNLQCHSIPIIVDSLQRILDAVASAKLKLHFTRSAQPKPGTVKITRSCLYNSPVISSSLGLVADAHTFTYADWEQLSRLIVKFNDVYIHFQKNNSLPRKHFLLQLSSALGVDLHARRRYNGDSLVQRILAAKRTHCTPATV